MGSTIVEALKPFSRLFEDIADKGGYRVLYSATDRHGIIEWRAVRPGGPGDDGLNRFLSLGIAIGLSPGGEPIWYRVFLEVDVDDMQGFGRQPVRILDFSAHEDPKERLFAVADDWLSAAGRMTRNEITSLYRPARVSKTEVSTDASDNL